MKHSARLRRLARSVATGQPIERIGVRIVDDAGKPIAGPFFVAPSDTIDFRRGLWQVAPEGWQVKMRWDNEA